MSNRISNLFRQKKENILSIYFTAGYPNLNDTLDIIKHLDDAGVDLIEIGFPFSDPLADGPTIQESSQKAIENGMNLSMLFEQLEDLRKFTEIPIVLMGYFNPVLQFGEDKFIQKCQETGVDGIILPDMPLDYFEDYLKTKFEAANLCNVLLITPETSEERIQKIDALSTGFVYMVSSNSITGGNKNMNLQEDYFKHIQNMQLSNPRLIGFGIYSQSTFENACQYGNGAIIGSAFIKHLAQYGVSQKSIQSFIKSIRS